MELLISSWQRLFEDAQSGSSMATYELRDPIHKRIPFNDFERKIIDHPFVQRLRFVSQLSFIVSYVYPGGTHDRFSHVLGSMHVAGRLIGRMRRSLDGTSVNLDDMTWIELKQVMRLAGLLHDVGHGPFSHSSETVFPHLSELPLISDWWKGEIPDRRAKHEDYSVLLIQVMAEEGVMSETMAQDVASLIHADIKPSQWFLDLERDAPSIQKICKSLISGEIDCDRMDYLLRDSYYCGVAYGNYDIDWLISSLGFAVHDGRIILRISENGVRALEDMLLARYHMIDQVYYHKTKVGFAHYLTHAFLDNEIKIQIPGEPYEYAGLRDGTIIELLHQAADRGEYWSKHLMDRAPAKHIMRLRQDETQKLGGLVELCKRENVRYFVEDLKNDLSHFDREKDRPELFVAKKTLRGVENVPIEEYSGLLRRYNEKIRFTDFFVLREDYDKFKSRI